MDQLNRVVLFTGMSLCVSPSAARIISFRVHKNETEQFFIENLSSGIGWYENVPPQVHISREFSQSKRLAAFPRQPRMTNFRE